MIKENVSVTYFNADDVIIGRRGDIILDNNLRQAIVNSDIAIYESADEKKYVITNRFGSEDTLPIKSVPTDVIQGYHTVEIEKGTFGEASKIVEEFNEWMDARNQGSRIMELVELSDLYGAIRGYIMNRFNLGMDEVEMFSDITTRAFLSGARK